MQNADPNVHYIMQGAMYMSLGARYMSLNEQIHVWRIVARC